MSDVLTCTEAKEIYDEILQYRQEADEAIDDLYEDLDKKAVRYANIRASWHGYTRAEKLEKDSGRTAAHDAFIAAVNIIGRYQTKSGAGWWERLGDDRKRIGDFACYLALFLALDAR